MYQITTCRSRIMILFVLALTAIAFAIWIVEFRFTLHSNSGIIKRAEQTVGFCKGPTVFSGECIGSIKVNIDHVSQPSSRFTFSLNHDILRQWSGSGTPQGFVFLVDSECQIQSSLHFTTVESVLLQDFIEKRAPGVSVAGVLHRTAHWIELFDYLGGVLDDVPCSDIKGNGDFLFYLQPHGSVAWSIVTEPGLYYMDEIFERGEEMYVMRPSREMNLEMTRRQLFPIQFSPESSMLAHLDVSVGGSWRPPDCQPTTRLALIIPYRNRPQHRDVFLPNIITFLKMQLVEFTIFIVEQAKPEIFNRAYLMNIGYLEAKSLGDFDCYVFHDVDTIPQNLANVYTCSEHPRHLAVVRYINGKRVSARMQNKKWYDYFGGVIAMSPEQIERINGFSNRFFGWGGEDDEMLARIYEAGYEILRYPEDIATYISLKHVNDKGNPHMTRGLVAIQEYATKYGHVDGLSSVNYTVKDIEKRSLYTWMYVQIPGPRDTKELERFNVEFDNLLHS